MEIRDKTHAKKTIWKQRILYVEYNTSTQQALFAHTPTETNWYNKPAHWMMNKRYTNRHMQNKKLVFKFVYERMIMEMASVAALQVLATW